MRPDQYQSGSWFHDEPFFLGNTPGSARKGSLVLKDVNNTSFIDNWGSAHSSAANFLMADGSVRTIRYTTSQSIMHALLTPQGQELIHE